MAEFLRGGTPSELLGFHFFLRFGLSVVLLIQSRLELPMSCMCTRVAEVDVS